MPTLPMHPALLPRKGQDTRTLESRSAYILSVLEERPAITKWELARHMMAEFKVQESTAYRWLRKVRKELLDEAEGAAPNSNAHATSPVQTSHNATERQSEPVNQSESGCQRETQAAGK